MITIAHLPGSDLITRGIQDSNAGRITPFLCLLAIGRSRLARAGLDMSSPSITLLANPEDQLYRLLCQEEGDPYSRYNSMIRQLISFEQSLERQNSKRVSR